MAEQTSSQDRTETKITATKELQWAADQGLEVRHAWCQLCGPAKTTCSTLCYLKEGKWVAVEGNPLAGNNRGQGCKSLCVKGQAAMQVLSDPTRLSYPQRRVGPKGSGEFERCTWDEALADIAERLSTMKRDYGAKALGILSPQAYPVLWTLGRRFLNVFGSPNYLHSGICALQRQASTRISIGRARTAPSPAQLDKTKLLVLWGANGENSRGNQTITSAIARAMKQGLQVIDIRPMMDPFGAKASLWLPIRPGTDCALALAILSVIIGEGLYDHDFVRDWCSGFDELADHVKNYPPEWAAPITGIPAEQICEVARLMGATSPMAINYGNGIGDQQNDGNWACVAINLIEAITGNLDIPGGGVGPAPAFPPLIKTHPIDLLTERLTVSDADESAGYFAGMADLVAPETPRWYQNPKTWESGPNSAYFKGLMSILTEEPYPLRALICQATNPLGATRQPKRVAEALKKLDLLIVHDTHWTPTCDYADYVLPACTSYESSQQFAVKNSKAGTFIGLNQKIAEPLGESRSDWDFYLSLAVALGLGDDFWQGDMDACLREQLEGSGVTLEELRAAPQGIFIQRPADAKPKERKWRDYERLFADLPGGKVQCANDWIGGQPSADDRTTLSRVPIYTGPPEGIAQTPELAQEYPLILSDVHAYRLCTHSYYVGVPWLREHQPYPWVRINPATAHKYGIADGDWVRVESPHGWVKLKAEYFEGIAPEVLMARRGWWQACPELGLPGYGCLDGGSEVSVLYDSDESHFDPFHSAMAKQTLVRISKLDDAEIPVGKE